MFLRQHPRDRLGEILQKVVGFENRVRKARSKRAKGQRFVRMPGDQDGRKIASRRLDPRVEIDPRGAGEMVVEHDQRDPVVHDVRHRGMGHARGKDAKPRAREMPLRERSDAGIVLHEEDRLGDFRVGQGGDHGNDPLTRFTRIRSLK